MHVCIAAESEEHRNLVPQKFWYLEGHFVFYISNKGKCAMLRGNFVILEGNVVILEGNIYDVPGKCIVYFVQPCMYVLFN
jgi:hypothetical protein